MTSWLDTIKCWHSPCKLTINKIEQLNEDGTTEVLYERNI